MRTKNNQSGNVLVTLLVVVMIVAVGVVMYATMHGTQTAQTTSTEAEEIAGDALDNFLPEDNVNDPRPTIAISTEHHMHAHEAEILENNKTPISNEECQQKGGTCIWVDAEYNGPIESCGERNWEAIGYCEPESPFPVGFCCKVTN